MSNDLLPCPFCGSRRLSLGDAPDFISCIDCGAEGPFLGCGLEASIDAWNTRVFGASKPAPRVGVKRSLGMRIDDAHRAYCMRFRNAKAALSGFFSNRR